MNPNRSIKRRPTAPGEILNEEFLGPLGMTQKQLADHVGCDVKVVNRITRAHQRRSPFLPDPGIGIAWPGVVFRHTPGRPAPSLGTARLPTTRTWGFRSIGT